MGGVWKENEYLEHYQALPTNRKRLVDGYAKRYEEADDACYRRRVVGRKLTHDEERIGALIALTRMRAKR